MLGQRGTFLIAFAMGLALSAVLFVFVGRFAGAALLAAVLGFPVFAQNADDDLVT